MTAEASIFVESVEWRLYAHEPDGDVYECVTVPRTFVKVGPGQEIDDLLRRWGNDLAVRRAVDRFDRAIESLEEAEAEYSSIAHLTQEDGAP